MTCDVVRDLVLVADDPLVCLAHDGAVRTHLGSCEACRAWAARLAEGLDLASESAADLSAGVLAHTRTSACTRAQSLITAMPDEALDSFDQQLLTGHLAGCASCRVFQATVADLSATLPALASLAVDSRFLDDVLARTSRRPARSSVVDTMIAWWNALLQRPRLALEVAYLCTIIWLVVAGLPSTTFDWTTVRVSASNRTVGAGVDDARARVRAMGERVRSDVEARASRLAAGRVSLGDRLADVWQSFVADALNRAEGILGAVVAYRDSMVAWLQALFAPPPAPAVSGEPQTPSAR